MRKKSTPYTFFHQYTSAILIFILFLTQTIHVSFFDRVDAGTTDYRDVVSIIVDADTYGSLRSKIDRYARDIQGYLKDTRTFVVVTPSGTTPQAIAAKNEKLYYEGDGGDGVSHLVGTVIIGNIPLPVVHKDDISFPSLYPYVDFDDKSFVYNSRSNLYEYSSSAPTNVEVDIWHGVMNPAIGREWQGNADVLKIGLLLDKTHDFYTKQGKFIPSTLPPQVFYYDGYAESKSVDARSFYKYVLFLLNGENLAYRRFTKYLLKDISIALRQYSQSSKGSENDYLNTIQGYESVIIGDDSMSDSSIDTLPDIQTAKPIGKFLLKFHEIINEKTLGDIQKFVHNAGRYNSGITVHVDQGALQMSIMDEVSLRTIKEANDGIEKAIDQMIEEKNYARKIVIFDRLEKTQTGYTSSWGAFIPFSPSQIPFQKKYLGYFFGKQAKDVSTPEDCTIARGNTGTVGDYGRSVLVEANAGYDIGSASGQINILSSDTQELVRAYGAGSACLSNASAKLQSYWGGNSILRITSNPQAILSIFNSPPSGTSFTGFSLPIFSLGGMKETERISSPTLRNCFSGTGTYEYALLQPYEFQDDSIEYGDRTVRWPKELGRFTCITQHEFLEKPIRSLAESIEDYGEKECFQGSLSLDNKYLTTDNTLVGTETILGKSCNEKRGDDFIDTTLRENRHYHSIPSLMKHVSPTSKEIQIATENGTTPSLAVDQIRSFEFLTPKGNVAKLTYPNLFEAQGKDITSIRAWIKDHSDAEWNAIIAKEKSTNQGKYDAIVSTLVGAGSLPSAPIDWNILISDDLISQVLRAKNWLNPNVTKKYQSLIETNLSYSHEYGRNDPKNPPLIPRSGSGYGYEIAYLGLTPFSPKGENSSDTEDMSDYAQQMATLDGLNFSEDEPGDANPDNAESAKCGPPDGVPLFEWPGAIMCWIKTLFPPKILTNGACGANTIGLPVSPAGEKGDQPLPPLAGDCSTMEFRPLSNTIVTGAHSAGILRLLDNAGKPMSPNFHDVTLKIQGGYFIDAEGAHKDTLKIATVEAEQIFSYGADTPGDIVIGASLENGVRLPDIHIRAISVAKIRIHTSGDPQVGGDPIDVTFEITDANGAILTGFDSALSIDMPVGAGSFSGEVFEIKNGKSDPIRFTPGRIAGDNLLALDIPGIGYVTDVPLKIRPGQPFYINGNAGATSIEFTLRDRYGNLTPVDMPATVRQNSQNMQNVNFSSGKYVFPKSPGYWKIEAPALANTKLTYTDTENTQDTSGVHATPVVHTLTGIPFYVLYVAEGVGKYNFLPDYNARYTVLAGDSFLREGEDILYHATPGQSQSLAVSTILTSPYEQSSIFSIFPGGGYSIAQNIDTAVDSSVTLEGGDIILSVYDAVSRSRIARVAYPTRTSQIRFSLPDKTDYEVKTVGENISLMRNSIPRVSYTKSQGITLAPGMKLVPVPEKSSGFLTLSLRENGNTIGEITITTDQKKSVDVAANIQNRNTLTLESSYTFTRVDAYSQSFDPNARGYSLVRNNSKNILEERMIGQNGIDSIGSLSEIPGVGWHDNNRSLLSYAAGDTVGEATRWYHSYTFVNLGDPVAHVDAHAPGTELEGIDRTIGTQISGGVHGSIQSFSHRDMDGDGKDDIIIVYDDGFIELLQNIDGRFRRKQMIAYIPNIGDRGLEFGDFTGDRYADIVAVDKNGKLLLIDNTKRKLASREINIEGGLASPTGITQLKVYDMDHDGKDDIVFLTEGGELAILYGTATSGTFTKKILESTLGVRLSGASEKAGGAVRSAMTPSEYPANVPTTSTGASESVLHGEVFYERPAISAAPISTVTTRDMAVIEATLGSVAPTSSSKHGDIYVRSEYAPAYGLSIERSYANTTSDVIHSGDKILATITVRNTSTTQIARNVEYLDTIPKIFDASDTLRYTITSADGQKKENTFKYLPTEEYDAYLNLGDIPAGATLTLTYELKALPASYGTMIVDNLEKGLVGDDVYGDVGFRTSNTCGADIVLWSSTAVRSYERGTRSFGTAELPPSLVGKLTDADKNGVPDGVENADTGAINDALKKAGDGTSLTQDAPLFTSNYDPSGRLLSLGFSSTAIEDIENIVQNLANGFACGFGGGSCISFPVNYAFNMPGSSVSILGTPVSALTPVTGIGPVVPVFSFPTFCGPLSPPIWPPCSFNAGGTLPGVATGFRVFAGMTMTLAAVGAFCYSPNVGPAAMNYLFPLNPLGNCIGGAVPLPVCKGDGSEDDGSVTALSGLGSSTTAWNGASCSMTAKATTSVQDASLIQDVITYLKSPNTTRLTSIYSALSSRGSRSLSVGPLLSLGAGSASDGTAIDISMDLTKPFSLGDIIKVKNRRIAGFPEFIMDWVARQTDEITNKLLAPPSLVIVPPRTFGQNATLDGSFSDFLNKFSKDRMASGYEEFKNKVAGAGNVNVASSFNRRTTGNTTTSKGYNDWLDKKVTENSSTINRIAGGANQMKAAYQFIGQLPFLRIEQDTIPINIPWILPQELDRYSRALDSYKSTIENAKKGWCAGKTAAECTDQHTNLGLGALSSTIEANLKRLEEYKRFPEKIQKYLTWKERYITQLLCNVDSLEQVLGGWYRDNGVRFRKWAEFYVLLKAIVDGWQPFLDIFKIKDEQCSVCRNERNDLKDFTFRLLSAIIPQLPILQFPKWPDIVLDLSDIRLGIAIKVPNFDFNINPIRLPDLPMFSLPNMPSVSLDLPGINILPSIPPLPDLPDLPSLPKIALPSLPPPPKLPKIFGSVAAVLNMLKLFAKIYCFYQKTPLIPEAELGTVLAQRTDRQGTLSFDFLKIKFPQFSVSSLKEIRASTHVNFNLRSDFISTFARGAVKPLNSFGADMRRIGPAKVAPDLNIQAPANINITPRSSFDTLGKFGNIALLEDTFLRPLAHIQKDADILLDSDTFISYYRRELARAGQDTKILDRSLEKSRRESDAFIQKTQNESTKGFSLLREYLHTEKAENAKLQKTLDTLQNKDAPLLSDNSLPRAFFISRDEHQREQSLARYTEWREDQGQMISSSYDTPSRERRVASYDGQISRLMANAAVTQTSPAPNTAAGYNPKYEGIYILTPISKKQTRLFDYTDLVSPDDTVQITDIDGDRDDDYIFLLSGKLYIKYSHQKDPERSNDTTSKVETLDKSILPVAPNYFHESVASPGRIEVSFSPANPNDSSFRLEFFDRYMEWDRVAIDGRESTDTPRTIIDLTTTQEVVVRQDGVEATQVDRYLKSVDNTSDFILEGQKVSVLKEGQPFTLSAGRALYTGTKPAGLRYSSGATLVDMTLAASRRYVFPFALSGSITSEKVFVLSPSGTEKLIYSPDMLGMPLLPEAHIQSAGRVVVYDPIHGSPINTPTGSTYRQISLGKKSETYSVNFAYPNGFYSARLHTPSGEMIRAGVTLLAPQESLDSSPPVVDLSEKIRIPVYQSKSLKLSDFITEMSSYTIALDGDSTFDSNRDGIYDNDFSLSGTGFTISNTLLNLGTFDTLGPQHMNMQVMDIYGNTTLAPLEIDVYAPIPQIQSVSSMGMLSGVLSESVSLEPVHFFRIRESDGLKKLFEEKTNTNADGVFATGSLFVGSGVMFGYSGGTLRLDEYTGLPLGNALMTRFLPATGTDPMRIIFSKSGKDIFTESIIPPRDIHLSTTSIGFDALPIPSLMMTPEVGYSFVSASLSDPNIPGGMYLVDSEHRPILSVDIRGQVYTTDSSMSFDISSGKYLTLIPKKGGAKVATLIYKTNFFYTVQDRFAQ